MKEKLRKLTTWIAGLALVVSAPIAVIGSHNAGHFELPEGCIVVQEHNVAICPLPEDDTTTTTTVPETTTTTVEDTTTTTVADTTTTTTPQESELVIPETLPMDDTGMSFKDTESFQTMIQCADSVDKRTDEVLLECENNQNGKGFMASFDYFAHGMPYLYSEAQPGMHDHAWWVAGDREGYRCAYGFMYDKHPNPFGNTFDEPRDAEFISRFTIVRPDTQSYGTINDKYMDEGERYYNGTVANEGGQEISEDCQQAALDDFDYDAYEPHGADDIRVGLFRGDGEPADVRDFTEVDIQVKPDGTPMGHFEFVSIEDGRITIVFVLEQNNKVSHVFYYDVMNSGLQAVEVNGELITE